MIDGFATEELQSLTREKLRQLFDEKNIQYDRRLQGGLLKDRVSSETAKNSELFHSSRMFALLKESAESLRRSGTDPATLNKLEAYIELGEAP